MNVTITIMGDRQGRRDIQFQKPGEYLIGRAEEAHCQVDDGRVSKLHVRLLIEPLSVSVRDMNSSNGTIVDGLPLGGSPKEPPNDSAPPRGDGAAPDAEGRSVAQPRKEAILRDGSVIELGSTRLYVHLSVNPEELARVKRWMEEGEREALRALEIFERVLALDPSNKRAAAMIEALRPAAAVAAAPPDPAVARAPYDDRLAQTHPA